VLNLEKEIDDRINRVWQEKEAAREKEKAIKKADKEAAAAIKALEDAEKKAVEEAAIKEDEKIIADWAIYVGTIGMVGTSALCALSLLIFPALAGGVLAVGTISAIFCVIMAGLGGAGVSAGATCCLFGGHVGRKISAKKSDEEIREAEIIGKLVFGTGGTLGCGILSAGAAYSGVLPAGGALGFFIAGTGVGWVVVGAIATFAIAGLSTGRFFGITIGEWKVEQRKKARRLQSEDNVSTYTQETDLSSLNGRKDSKQRSLSKLDIGLPPCKP
jgi:hypothetical protein